MPPQLDLSNSTHAKVMVAPPRINLRRAASYNNHERNNAMSSTSSRFNFDHLFFSPPPSPGLPSLNPRPKRSPSHMLCSRPSRLIRRFMLLLGVVSGLYLLKLVIESPDVFPALLPHITKLDTDHRMVGQHHLPDFPTPIVGQDTKGRSRWTVAIPPNHGFPLSIEDYSRVCSHCPDVSARARDLNRMNPLSTSSPSAYDTLDDYYVDVDKAERTGLLPAPAGEAAVEAGTGTGRWRGTGTGHFVGLDSSAMASKPVCDKSMTFVMESAEAGLGDALMMLWTFYGLAKSQGRAFFIDDSRWAYGSFADLFQAPPVPSCRPPPRHHIVPCPFQAKHLAVSSVTAKDVFPGLFAQQKKPQGQVGEVQTLVKLARTGYKDLFTLNKEDETYVKKRVAELQDKAKNGMTSSTSAPVIGLHIRHGDQHPLEYQYKDTYIPAEIFLDTAQTLVDAHYNRTDPEAEVRRSVTVVASDDPDVHEERSFAHAHLAQERIRLASKKAVQEADKDRHVLHAFVDEAFGWEGGFFAPMFWNLGAARKNNAANAPAGVLTRPASSEETLRLRSYLGRAYMMDLAVLAGASDKVVCAVSAMGCRLLAVMMGWDESFEKGAWVNVDGNYGWAGINW